MITVELYWFDQDASLFAILALLAVLLAARAVFRMILGN